MAQARRTKLTKSKPEEILTPTPAQIEAALAPFGLVPLDTVRFRRVHRGSWTIATVAGVNKDGSLHLFEPNGKTRAIFAELCEVKRKGPRGGVTWEPVVG